MPKLDLSKQGIGRFFLYHVEKIILGLAVVLMGVFLYMGMKTPAYTKKTPDQLSALASQAGSHITQAGWDEIKEHRVGDDKADERVASIKPVEIAQFDVGRFGGVRAKTKGRRTDPSLDFAIPKDFEIQVVKAPLVVNLAKNPLAELPLAGTDDEEFGGGGGSGRGAPGLNGESEKPKRRRGEEPVYGAVVTDIHRDLMQGYKPLKQAGGRNARSTSGLGSSVANIVAVNALVEHKNLYDEYKKTFENSMAYTPIRDRPRYAYVEIQHKRGGKWKPIGRQVRYSNSEMFGYTQANEVTHPYYHDEVLTGPIPQIAQFDYRKIATHSKIPQRIFEDPPADEEEEEDGDGFDNFGDSGADDLEAKSDDEEMKKEKGGIRLGSDFSLYEASNERIKPQADHKLFRFFHVLSARASGKQEYRVRIWLNDPNNEDPEDEKSKGKGSDKGRGSGPSRGAGPGAAGDGAVGGGSSGTGTTGDEEEKEEPELSAPYMKIEYEMKEQDVRDRIESEKLLREKDGDEPLPDTYVAEEKRGSARADDDDKATVNIAKGDLNYCRCTRWIEFSAEIPPSGASAEFYAGDVESGKKKAESGKLVQASDNFAEIVTAVWDLGTRIPYFKKVFRGDVLNMRIEEDKPIHVVNPVTLTVHSLEKRKAANEKHKADTNALVVDMLGGESVSVKSKLEFKTPGEILIMDASGKFHVQNTLNDAVNFRLSLLKEDDDNLFGKEKAKKDDEDAGSGVGG